MSDSRTDLPPADDANDAVTRALRALRAQDAAAENPLGQDVDALFESLPLVAADEARLGDFLRATLPALEAPAELDARVRVARERAPQARILRMTPRVAAWAAAAAVVFAVLLPFVLTSTSGERPRFVLHVVDEALDVRFDGRAMLHNPQAATRPANGGKGLDNGARDR